MTQLANFNADLWLLSPACQPYTVLNPNAKGATDPRARSFLYLVQDILPQLAKMNALPSRLLVENVAGFEVLHTINSLARPHLSLRPPSARLLLPDRHLYPLCDRLDTALSNFS